MHVFKAYVVLFVCFNTKAVHLELVTDVTEAFIAALQRFTGKRDICLQLYSDNITNFVGASKELEQVYEFLNRQNKTIQIEWNRKLISIFANWLASRQKLQISMDCGKLR